MARPKSDTPEGKLATERWRKTMKKRYGNVANKMQEIGSVGGSAPYKGLKGFAVDPELAKAAGKIGGTISRRRKVTA